MNDNLTDTPDGADPRTGLAAALALRTLADRIEQIHVERARALEWSWQDIAAELNLSRQAVHQRYGKAEDARTRKDQP